MSDLVGAAGLQPSSVRPILPSLEDVFIARLAEARRTETVRHDVMTHAPAPPPSHARASSLGDCARSLCGARVRTDVASADAAADAGRCGVARRGHEPSARRGAGAAGRRGGDRPPAHAADQPTVARQRRLHRAPTMSMSSVSRAGRRLRIVYPDIPDNYRARVEMQWPIYTGGRADALERAARAEAGATGSDLERRASRSAARSRRARIGRSSPRTEAVRVLEEALNRADAHLQGRAQPASTSV